MDYKELIEKAKEIDEKATPGPWMWDLNECNHQCNLTTTHSGKYYVMGFERWGLQSALPSFQVYDRYEGPLKDRGSHGMVRADKMSKSYPGKEHHHGFDNFIDHPDARYIAESRELFHLMITDITELSGKVGELEKDIADREEASVREHGETHYWRDKAKELEKQLSEMKQNLEMYGGEVGITSAFKQIEELKNQLAEAKLNRPIELSGQGAENFALAIQLSEMQQKLKEVTAERDAAIEDMKLIFSAGWSCFICAKENHCIKKDLVIGNCSDFLWRGKGEQHA